jgi:hypothetical protein
MKVLSSPRRLWLYLAGDEPSVNEPVDLAFARISRGTWRRYATPEEPEEFENSWVRFPVGSYTVDLLVHADVECTAVPTLTASLASFGAPKPPRDAPENLLNRIELGLQVADLGPLDATLSALHVEPAPSYPDLVRHAIQKAGWDPARFRAFRMQIEHPTPFVWYSWWAKLPER